MEYPFCCVDSVFQSQTRMLLMKTRTEKELLFEEENYPLNDQSNVDEIFIQIHSLRINEKKLNYI